MKAAGSLTRTRGAAAIAAALVLWAITGCTASAEQVAPAPTAPSSAGTRPSPTDSTSPDPSPAERTMTATDSQADREAIIANFQARQQAMIDADTDRLRALSTPGSHAEHISGYNQPRDEWFDQIDAGYFDYHAIDNHSVEVTLTGPGSATLVARSTIDVTIGGSRGTWRLELAADYLKQDGRWLSGDGSSRLY